jgi:adenosylmethionine-8-amino-7-oxononanoate aminotransferase
MHDHGTAGHPSPPRQSASIAAATLPKIAHGRGSYVWDRAGKRYLDGSGGPAVYCLGHGNAEVNQAIKDQLDLIAHGYRYNFTSDPLEELSERVARACGGALRHMVFVSSGSEAVESALKLALQYHVARGEARRCRFIARERSWHGNTLGALALSGFLERRAPFEGALVEVPRLSPVNAYRPPAGVAPDRVAEHCADELEAAILAMGAETVAAFVFEPVVGAAGGAVPAPQGYATRVREICDRHGVLMIADEVMCGSGRCGTWRALAHDGVEPDIMAVAKGLAGGYLPLGAAIYSDRISEAIVAAHGGPLTGHTFTGHTAACAAGAAVQRIVERDRLLDRIRKGEARLRSLLADALDGIDALGDIRGRGYFIGLEFVADRATREPFPAERKLHLRIRQRALEEGLICYPSGGNVDGVRGDTVIIAPPYNASDAELTELADLFGRATRRALADIAAG